MKRRQKDKAGSKRKARPAKAKHPKPGLPYTVMKDAPPSYAPEGRKGDAMAKKVKELSEKVSPKIGTTYDPEVDIKPAKGGNKFELVLAEKIGTEEK